MYLEESILIILKANIEGAIFVIWIDPPYDKEPEKELNKL